MEPFREVLTAGGHRNSLGRSAEVLAAVRADPGRLDELFACIGDDDAWVRMRAVDTFEKLVREDPERARPYLGRVLGDLTRSDQPSVQWHVAQVLAVAPLTAGQRRRAVAWLVARLETTEVDWIVAAQSLAALDAFERRGHVGTAELVRLLEVQAGHPSASVRRKVAGYLARVRPAG